MIIDFHTHTFPDKIAARALAHMQSLSHNSLFTDGTVSGLKQSMEESNIDYSVILPVATNPDKVHHINNISIASNGKEGLIYFGCMHPDYPEYKRELKRLRNGGVKGIKLHPLWQGVDIDDPRYLRILECAGELGMIVVMHSGDDPAFPGDIHAAPRMTRRAIRQVGPVKLVCAHMGGLMNWDEVLDQLVDTEVMIDTAFSLGKMSQTEEHYYTEEQLQLLSSEEFCAMIDAFGSDRVLFGTDSPWNRQKATVESIRNLPLSQEVQDRIFYQNALSLLNIN